MDINFIGDFKLLKGMGYKFQKLYASNYICYHKDDLWIWRKGKVLEIQDLYGNSHLILQYLIDHDFKIDQGRNDRLIINMEEDTLEKYDYYKHERGFGMTNEEAEKFFDTHRKFFIRDKIIQPLKELYEKGMIKIQ